MSKNQTATPTEIKAISAKFSEILNEWLTSEEINEINELNATPEYQSGACATHNFCDPNQAFLDAFESIMKRDFDFESDSDSKTMNFVWDMSRAAKFAV